jgi:ferric enterobactin receptor
VQDTWIPSARLVIAPGARVTQYDVTSAAFVEPRLSANYQLTSRLQLKGGYGTYHQVANRIQQEDLSQGDREFWVLADGQNVPIARSWQVAAGGSYETEGFLVDVEVYHKGLDDLTMFAPRLVGGQPPEAGASYLYYGSGTARGLEALFQKKFGVQTGWISYTLSKVEQRFPSLEADPFPASHDQRHEVKITDSVKLGAWTIGATWAFGSGRPYTPAQGIESVEIGDIGITVDRITYGAKNSATLPPYHRLDVSAQGDFRAWGMKSTIGVTAFNVYDRQNVWYRTYQTFGGSGAANDVTFMGRAFNLFYRIGF